VIVFDAYERRARLAPGLLALLPVSVAVVALGIDQTPVVSAFGGIATAAGGPILIADTVRSRGRRLETSLFKKWGGKPTTMLLRLSSTTDNVCERDRRRERLAVIAEVDLPDAKQERTDPDAADEIYELMTTYVREKYKSHDLAAAENRSYGFHRNMFAMRPVGIAISIATCLVMALATWIGEPSQTVIAGLALAAVSALVWIFWPTEARVREAADRYARQLFNTAMTG
jgi:hypothetical protein